MHEMNIGISGFKKICGLSRLSNRSHLSVQDPHGVDRLIYAGRHPTFGLPRPWALFFP